MEVRSAFIVCRRLEHLPAKQGDTVPGFLQCHRRRDVSWSNAPERPLGLLPGCRQFGSWRLVSCHKQVYQDLKGPSVGDVFPRHWSRQQGRVVGKSFCPTTTWRLLRSEDYYAVKEVGPWECLVGMPENGSWHCPDCRKLR